MNILLQIWKPFVAALLVGAALGSLGARSGRAPVPSPTAGPPPPAPPPRSPAAALAAISNAELPTHYDATTGKQRDLVASFWSRADPAAFLAHLTSTDPPFFSSPSHALHLFDTWATRDFDAALAAADTLSPYNPLRLHIQHRIVAKKFAVDPATAIAALDNIWANNGSNHSDIIPFLDDPQTSLPLLASLPRTDVASSAVRKTLAAWSESDPTAALAWAQENASPVADIIATAWRADPAVAAGLLPGITSPRALAATVRNLAVNVLRDSDPATAVSLIDTYLDGWTRHEAATKLADKIARRDPKLSAELALTFRSPAARAAALTTALEAFHRDAPNSLDLWLSSLPEGPSRAAAKVAMEKIMASPAPPAGKPSLPLLPPPRSQP